MVSFLSQANAAGQQQLIMILLIYHKVRSRLEVVGINLLLADYFSGKFSSLSLSVCWHETTTPNSELAVYRLEMTRLTNSNTFQCQGLPPQVQMFQNKFPANTILQGQNLCILDLRRTTNKSVFYPHCQNDNGLSQIVLQCWHRTDRSGYARLYHKLHDISHHVDSMTAL